MVKSPTLIKFFRVSSFFFSKLKYSPRCDMAKIVIIDDEPAMVEVIVTLCREKGHQVFPFNAAPKAVEQMDSIQPHVVIADIRDGNDDRVRCPAPRPRASSGKPR